MIAVAFLLAAIFPLSLGAATEESGSPIVLHPQVGDLSPGEKSIEALDFSWQLFLPLRETFQFLEIPIEIGSDSTMAGGYIFSPATTYFLDIDKREARVGDKYYRLSRQNIRRHKGELYISRDSLAEWFGIKTEVDREQRSIRFTIGTLAPKQEIRIGKISSPASAAAPSLPSGALPQNRVLLELVDDKRTLGRIEAYLDKHNTFLPFKRIIGLLGFSNKFIENTDTAEIVLNDGYKIIVDFQKREFIENNTRHSFYYYDATKINDEPYANIGLINRMLPKGGLVVDWGLQKITYSGESGIGFVPTEAASPRPGDLAPAPEGAPVQPVVVDDSTEPEGIFISGVPQEEAIDVLHITESAPAAKKTAALFKPIDKEEGEKKEGVENLILQPRVKDFSPSDEFIEVFDSAGQIFIPFADVVRLFEFPIKFDKEGNIATGFFLSQKNEVLFDVEKREMRIGNNRWDMTRRDVRRNEGRIYISTESILTWFGIASEVDRSAATIHFTTDKKLPQEEREERQRRWNVLLREVEKSGKDFPVLENPYQNLSYPVLDVNIGTMFEHSSGSGSQERTFSSNYNIQGSADIAQLTGNFYAQGSTDKEALDIFRVKAGRKDPNNALLGMLRASEFEFGDVSSPSLSLVTNNSIGRGVVITNRGLAVSENFDFRNFSGNSVPGYEAELYRNDVLVAFQTVDSIGRYNFTNIPILYGENIFRIVLYGEQGQREERVETISASSSLLKEHQFTYTFGLEQRGETLLPVGSNALATSRFPVGIQAVGDFRYGLTEDITIGAAMAETQLADGEHKYINFSSIANIGGVLAEGSFARDLTNDGWAASAAALGGFEGVSLRLRYRKFENYFSEAVNYNSTPLSSDMRVDANTQMLLPLIGEYSMGLSALREGFVDTSLMPRYTYSWRSSKSIGGISFTDSVDYVVDSQQRLQDTFGVQTRLFNVDLRAVGIMDIKPERRLREASFMADYKLMDKLSAQTQFNKNLSNNQTTYGQNFSWDFDDFRLSFTGQMSDNNSYSFGMNLIFSAQYDRLTESWRTQSQHASEGGAVSVRAYVDENNNSKMDENESVYPGTKIKINNALVKPDVDKFFAAPIPPYRNNHIELDTGSIEDPLLSPVSKDYNVVTRPGDNVVVDFPLVRTTIIDGTVVFLDDKGDKHEMGNIIVELEDLVGKPLRRVISAVDGYFSFDKVQAGDYLLAVPEEVLDSLNAKIEEKVHIKIDKIDEFMTDNLITLHQKEKLDAPPFMPLPSKPEMPGQPSLPPPSTPPIVPKSEEGAPFSEIKEDDPPHVDLGPSETE